MNFVVVTFTEQTLRRATLFYRPLQALCIYLATACLWHVARTICRRRIIITIVVTVVVTVVVVAVAILVVVAVVVAVGQPLAPRRGSAEDQRSNVLHRTE